MFPKLLVSNISSQENYTPFWVQHFIINYIYRPEKILCLIRDENIIGHLVFSVTGDPRLWSMLEYPLITIREVMEENLAISSSL